MFSYSEEDIRKLVLRCYGRLKLYVVRTAGLSDQAADDILQEALLKLLSQKPPVANDKIDGYFFRMVRNSCINLRTRSRKTISLDALETEAAWNLLAEVDMENADVAGRKDSDVRKILQFADSFKPRTRDIFQMSRIDGMTHEQIAEELGISVRAVEKHLQKSVIEYRKEFRNLS